MTIDEVIAQKLESSGLESLNEHQLAYHYLGEVGTIYAFGGISGLIAEDVEGYQLENCLPALENLYPELTQTLRNLLKLRGQANPEAATTAVDQFNCWTLLEELEQKFAEQLRA